MFADNGHQGVWTAKNRLDIKPMQSGKTFQCL